MPVEKTVEELFDEYVAMENNTYHYRDIDSKDRQQQIIQEVKSQVRREVMELVKKVMGKQYAGRVSLSSSDPVWIERDVFMEDLSKALTLEEIKN